MFTILTFIVTQPLVAASVAMGFVIGGASLFLVHRQVADIGRKLDRQEHRLLMVEVTVRKIEKRWSDSQ